MFLRSKTYQPNFIQAPQLLTIRMNKTSFFTNEYIDGKIELNSAVPIVIDDIVITLTLLENWTNKSPEGGQLEDTHNEPLVKMNLEVKKQLNINSNLVSLAAGKFTFPFYFKIQKDVPPCFEYATSYAKASIRYSLDANVISPYIQGRNSTYILLKSRPNLQQKNLQFQVSSNIHKWGLFDAGSTIFNISINNNGIDSFFGNEDINMNISIDNTNGKLNADEIKFTLNRTVAFKSRYSVAKEFKDDCIIKKLKTETKVNEKKDFTFSMPLKELNNSMLDFSKAKLPYGNISDFNYFLKSVNSLIIECKYTLKGTLYFNKFVKYNDRPRIIIPINLCHQSVNDYNNEIQNYYNSQNYNNQYNNNQINNNQNYNNQYNNNQINNNQNYNNQYNNNQINNNQNYNNQYNNNQINNSQNSNNQYNNNQNNISAYPLQKSVSLNNNNPPPNMIPYNPNSIDDYNIPPPPNNYSQNINGNNNNNNEDFDLPSQAEIEKPKDGETPNLNPPPGFEAPPSFFPPNP